MILRQLGVVGKAYNLKITRCTRWYYNPNKKGATVKLTPFDFLAGPMGLEPTPSGVTGRRYNQLNYDPKKSFFIDIFKS